MTKHTMPTEKIVESLHSEDSCLIILADYENEQMIDKIKRLTPLVNEAHEQFVKSLSEWAEATGVKARLKSIIVLD